MSTSNKSEPGAPKAPGESRRAFTRKAVLGVGAVATLANRSAWADTVNPNCVSEASWLSYDGGAYSSLTGGVTDAKALQAKAEGLDLNVEKRGDHYCIIDDNGDIYTDPT